MSDWKYDLDEVGPDGQIEEDSLPPVEKGSPGIENAVFVLIGVSAALYVFVTLLGLG